MSELNSSESEQSDTKNIRNEDDSNSHATVQLKHSKRRYNLAEQYNQINSLLAKCGFFSKYINSRVEKLFKTSPQGASSTGATSSENKRKHLEEEDDSPRTNKMVKLNDGQSIRKDDSNIESGNKVHILGYVVDVNQPLLLDGGILRDYQLQGLQWLILLFENGLNGILADEMGLGKTLQIISFICHLFENNLIGPFLIIAPLTTLSNWKNEFNRFASQVPIVIYHGTMSERMDRRKEIKCMYNLNGTRVFPVVITSFEMSIKDRAFFSYYKWKYLIVDEGHRLKNYKSVLARTLSSFPKVNSLLLTGTPLQNNLSELWSLLHFILPQIFDKLGSFNEWLGIEDVEDNESTCKLIEQESGTNLLSALHNIIRPFMLRRVKSDVSLDLPPKKEIVIFCPMSDIQVELSMHIFIHVNKKCDNSNITADLIIPNDPNGARPIRHARKIVDYSKLLKNSPKQTKNVSEEILDAPYLPETSKEIPATSSLHGTSVEIVSAPCSSKDKSTIEDSHKHINENYLLKLNNVGMLLRKIADHPYLLRRPTSLPSVIDDDIINSSGKMLVLDTLLKKLKERGHKVIIFSNFTTMLNFIEELMDYRGYTYKRLDGSTKLADREKQIKDFTQDSEIFVFLISTRAGSLGINLVSADTVVLFDSDWNPQVDLQAQDRCHRIGQKKPVIVYRLVSKGTIDEQIVNRATSKLKLERLVISKGTFKQKEQIGEILTDLEELKNQLNVNRIPVTISDNGSVLIGDEWDNLLDREKM